MKLIAHKKLILAAFLMSTSCFTLLSEANAQTDTNVVQPLYGTISPYYGKLSPFYGKLSPFYGKLSPFYGKLSPFYGKLSPFYGKLSPFTATTDKNLIGIYGAGVDPRCKVNFLIPPLPSGARPLMARLRAQTSTHQPHPY